MSIYHDLYGIITDTDDIYETQQHIAERLDKALGLPMIIRDSDWTDTRYCFEKGLIAEEMVVLRINYVDYEEAWAQPEHKDCPFLLSVSNSARGLELEALLKNMFQDKIKMIRRTIQDDETYAEHLSRAQMVHQYVQEIIHLEKDGASKDVIDKKRQELKEFRRASRPTRDSKVAKSHNEDDQP